MENQPANNLKHKYFPHLFGEDNITATAIVSTKQQQQQQPQRQNERQGKVSALATEKVVSFPVTMQQQQFPTTTVPGSSSGGKSPSTYGHSHMMSKARITNISSSSNSSGSSNDHSTISSLTQQSTTADLSPPHHQASSVSNRYLYQSLSASTTAAVAPAPMTSEHQPHRSSLSQISSAHDVSIKTAFTSSNATLSPYQRSSSAFGNESITISHYNALVGQSQYTPYKSSQSWIDNTTTEEDEDLPFSPPRDQRIIISPAPRSHLQPSMEFNQNNTNNDDNPTGVITSTEEKKEETESTEDEEIPSFNQESLKDLLLMKSLSLLEKIVVILFIILIMIFQLTVNFEDLLTYDYKTNGLWFAQTACSLLSEVAKDSWERMIQQAKETDWKRTLIVMIAVSYLTYFFDRDIDRTDLYLINKIHQIQEVSIRIQSKVTSTLQTLIQGYYYLIRSWNKIPRLVQYCSIFFLFSTAVKYGLFRVLMSMKPTIVRISLKVMPYITAIFFFIGLFQLISMWRMKSIRRQVAIEMIYERIKSIIQTKDEFYSMDRMKEDMEQDETMDLEEYSVEELWNEVRNKIKGDNEIQLNDFYVEGKKVQHLGFKPNHPTKVSHM
jgi:hypothetical protein